MEEIIKIASFCVITAVLLVVLKTLKSEISVGILIAASIVIFSYALSVILKIIKAGQDIVNLGGLGADEIELVFKIVISTYVVEFARGICIDTGEIGLAQKIDMCGRIYLVMLILPTCISLIATIVSFVG